jgi:hypothetical protein
MFKDIEGFEGRYQINEKGEVYSLLSNLILKQLLGGNGYYKVGLWDTKGTKHRLITHRLVAKAFVENKHGKPQVNHIDGDKLNNNACNLEWCTPKENAQHAVRTGLKNSSYHNTGKKLGKTSKYHYVFILNSKKDGKCYRAYIHNDKLSKCKQFSVNKYGELEAERLAAVAANKLIMDNPEFKDCPLNIL